MPNRQRSKNSTLQRPNKHLNNYFFLNNKHVHATNKLNMMTSDATVFSKQ